MINAKAKTSVTNVINPVIKKRRQTLPQERQEFRPQQRDENIPWERGEFLPQLREGQLFREREEHLPQESEGQDRERERVEHGVPKCEDEGDIFDAEILLDFIKTIGEFNLPTSDIETPQTSTTMDVPQPPTTAGASTHICGDEGADSIPVSFFKHAIIPAPSIYSYLSWNQFHPR